MDPNQPQSPSVNSPIYQESGEKNAKWLWLLIILIIAGALGFAYFRGIGPFASLKSGGAEPSPSPSSFSFSSPSPSAEASAGATVDKSVAKIKVLNGSGTAGVASTVKDLLEGKGWKVASVGNADNYDYTQTVLKFKSAAKKYESALSSDLSSKYSVITSSEPVEASDSADIIVIVGSK